MPGTFPQKRESELADGSALFAAVTSNSPVSYGLTTAQAAEFQDVDTAWQQAFLIASASATRSPMNIQLKDEAKLEMLTLAKQLVKVCQAWPEMSNSKRSELGIPLRKAEPTPIGPPNFTPKVDVQGVMGWTALVRVVGPDVTRRGRPDGVAATEIYYFVGETTPALVENWKFIGSYTRTTVTLHFPTDLPVGSKLWLVARYLNPRQQCGPTGESVFTRINYGGLAKSAAEEAA